MTDSRRNDPEAAGWTPIEKQRPEVLLQVTNARLTEDESSGTWWLFFSDRLRYPDAPGTYLDLGAHDQPPEPAALEQIVRRYGLTADHFGSWGGLRGPAGSRTLSTRLTPIATAELAIRDLGKERRATGRSDFVAQRGWTAAVCGLSALMLVVAIGNHEYSFYTVLRVVVTLSAGILTALARSARANGWLVGLIPAGILWNPIWPIFMSRQDWQIADVVGATFFGAMGIWALSRKQPA